MQSRWGREFGHDLIVTNPPLRTWEKSAEYYSMWYEDRARARKELKIQTRPAPPGASYHNAGPGGFAYAIDIDADPNAPASRLTPPQERLIIIGRDVGLVCGADWNDNVHFQYEFDRWDNFRRWAKAMDTLQGLVRGVSI